MGLVPHIYSTSTITTSKLTKGSVIVASIVGAIIGLVILYCIFSLTKEWIAINRRNARMEAAFQEREKLQKKDLEEVATPEG